MSGETLLASFIVVYVGGVVLTGMVVAFGTEVFYGGWSFLLLQRMAQCALRLRGAKAAPLSRHFDFLCSAVEEAISRFHEGHRYGDCGRLHIDDLEAVRRVVWAAHDLCDGTECTPHADEFGEHLRVPVELWRSLATAMRGASGDLAEGEAKAAQVDGKVFGMPS